MSNLLKKDKGFTLIEVVIVLAIAALIILVVLQAVSAAQKSNRDSTRKTEGARMVSAFEEYLSNNNGVYPPDTATAQAAIVKYDAALGSKYPAANFLTASYTAKPASGTDAFAAAANTACGTITAGDYKVVYAPATAVNARDYRVAACLEGVQNANVLK